MDALTTPSNWQRVRLGDICEITTGSLDANEMVHYGKYRFYTCAKEYYFIDKYAFDTEAILISGNGAYVGYVHYYKGKFNAYQRTYVLDNFSEHIMFVKYFLTMFLQSHIQTNKNEGNTPYIVMATLKDFEILLPPLNEQIAIANILSDVDHYLYTLDALILKKESVKKALRIKMLNQILASNGVEFRELGDIILSLKTGLNPRSFFKLNTPNANNYYVTIRELEDYTIKFTHQTDRIDDNALSLCLKRSNLEKDDILFSGTGTIGKVSIIEKNPNNWAIKEGIYSIKPNKKIVFPRFLMFCLESSNIQNDIKNKSFGGIVKSIPMNDLQQIQIPLPPLNEQIAIANILSDLDHEIISLKNKKRQFDNIKKALNHDLMSAKIRVLNK
ncbi:restriction endonuclease subunit S [Helicobacter pylori]